MLTRLLILPLYGPDIVPTVKAFVLIGAMLRKAGERFVSGLWSLIGKLLDPIRPQDCANYLALRLRAELIGIRSICNQVPAKR